MDRYIGKMLDNRYEILEVIGTGGMAVVYKARCHRLNRLVAIKVLRDDLARDAEFRRRFHDESQAVAMLSHPNIMAVYDVSRSADLEYIVMELIDGITLKQYMQKKGAPLNWRESLHFITQIMKALSHAHSRGIIHRDIKPQNIMVLRDGSVKVTDFGIARLASAVQNTLTQEALGSVHYISPEQAKGSRIDGRSDIYSAGVVLYEMLTGRLPFEGDTPVSVAIQHINSIPLPPKELNPDIPEALESITMKAMAPNADNRYINADSMLADLEEFRKNPSINFDYSAADLLPPSDAGDEPTQIIDTGRRRVQPVRSAGHVSRKEPEDGAALKEEERRHGGMSIPLAIGSVLLFVLGLAVLLWVIFFSNIFEVDETYTVPDLSNKTVAEAQADSEVVKGQFSIVEGGTVASSTVAAGKIVSQSPDAQTQVGKDGRAITVIVSAGESPTMMPNLVNKEYREALVALQQLGLTADDPVYETSDTVTANYVIRTVPAADEAFSKDVPVSLVISKGPDVKKFPVPAVAGLMNVEDATKMLQDDLGFVVKVDTVDSDQPEGWVLRQSIDPNQELEVGSTITLQVSNGSGVAEATPSNGGTQTGSDPSAEPSSSEPDASAPTVGGDLKSKSIEITLPKNGNPADVIQVRVSGSGIDHVQPVERRIGRVVIEVLGSGQQKLDIYFDGVYDHSIDVDFDS